MKFFAVVRATGVDLRVGKEPLHRVGHDMLCRMTNHIAAVFALSGHDLDRGVFIKRTAQVNNLAVDSPGEGSLCEPGADSFRHLKHRRAVGHHKRIAVRKTDADLAHELWCGMLVN